MRIAVFDEVTRDNIDRHVVREFGRPKWCDARVKLVERDGRRAILKDVNDRPAVFRFTLGRCLIRREFRIYERLEGIEGVPDAYRRLDRDGFLIEYIDGTAVTRKELERGQDVDESYYRRCAELLEVIHARGIVHLDLRNGKNFILGEDGRPHIVDFASALYFPRWVPGRRRIVRLLGAFDRAGLLKAKQKLTPELLAEGEREWLARFERTRGILFPHVPILKMLRQRRRRRAKEARRQAGDGPA